MNFLEARLEKRDGNVVAGLRMYRIPRDGYPFKNGFDDRERRLDLGFDLSTVSVFSKETE